MSIAISFLLPLLLGVEEFGFWQLFVFYSQYAGFFHFGLVDGIYLKEGGQLYKNLDFLCLGYQLRVMIIVNCLLIVIAVLIGVHNTDVNRTFVVISSSIYILVSNIISFFTLTLQSVNEIKKSSLARLFFSVSFLLFIVLEFGIIKDNRFQIFIIVYIITHLFSLIYLFNQAKEILKSVFTPSSVSYRLELWRNIKNGLTLTLANVTGLLILGLGRFMIDKNWGIEVFSVVSFSLVIVNFVLMFISQVSLVLYPELRALGSKESERLYKKITSFLSLVSPLFLLSIYPMEWIILNWLPAYLESINYMIILLPVCIFETKNQMQINTYFKVYNRPKDLLIANISAVAVSGFLILVAVLFIHSVITVVISMLVAVIAKYITSLYMLHPTTFRDECISLIPELLLTIAFSVINYCCSVLISIIIIVGLMVLYLSVKKNDVHSLISVAKNTFK